jgi:hypothetical protein
VYVEGGDMRKTYRYFFIWTLILVIVMACTVSLGGKDEGDTIQTAVAQTVAANQNGQQDTGVQSAEPTLTLEPTNTVQNPPTSTPKPCNAAQFVSETVSDGTEFDVGESFTKTWRLQNVGTCTWNTDYKLVFKEGDKMSGPSSQNLSQSVAPGESVDISINLKAPGTAGTYKGIWQVKDDNGQVFVYNIWAEIEAKAVLAPPPVAKPDLTISEFSINPNPPTEHVNAHIRVRAHNAGAADSGGFKMEWYGLSTYPDPSCSWNIAGGLVAGGSVLMECDFSFQSWYPTNRVSVAYIDTDDAVDESNESNNSASISGFGVLQP